MSDKAYRVSFFKNLVSSDGHRFKCLQEAITVKSQSSDDAVRAAEQQFERDWNIENWRLHADEVEAVED
jgi:hypothetical protein